MSGTNQPYEKKRDQDRERREEDQRPKKERNEAKRESERRKQMRVSVLWDTEEKLARRRRKRGDAREERERERREKRRTCYEKKGVERALLKREGRRSETKRNENED